MFPLVLPGCSSFA